MNMYIYCNCLDENVIQMHTIEMTKQHTERIEKKSPKGRKIIIIVDEIIYCRTGSFSDALLVLLQLIAKPVALWHGVRHDLYLRCAVMS